MHPDSLQNLGASVQKRLSVYKSNDRNRIGTLRVSQFSINISIVLNIQDIPKSTHYMGRRGKSKGAHWVIFAPGPLKVISAIAPIDYICKGWL